LFTIGIVTFGPGNTNGPETYLLTLTAVNMVTSLVSISSPIDVLREITNPSTTVMGNGVAGNFLVEPLHTIEFIVSFDEGSRVTLKVICDGGYEVSYLYYSCMCVNHVLNHVLFILKHL